MKSLYCIYNAHTALSSCELCVTAACLLSFVSDATVTPVNSNPDDRTSTIQLLAKSLLWQQLPSREKEEVRFRCDICHKDFSTAYTMRRHRVIHNPNFLKHQCEFCPRRFNWIDNLRSHMQGVHGVVLQQGQRGRPRYRNRGSPDHRTSS